MSLVLANGIDVVRGNIRLPRIGVWDADLVVNSVALMTGSVAITSDQGTFALRGSVLRSGVFEGSQHVRVVGGAGGLVTRDTPPRYYQGATAKLVFGDILASVGEKISPLATGLDTVLARWVVMGGPSRDALAALLGRSSWRILPDGTVWTGAETWPAPPNVRFDTLDRRYNDGMSILGVERPWLMPGTTLAGGRVSYVTHRINSTEVRTDVMFD